MTNLIICGLNGKMGKEVYEGAKKRNYNVICGVDKAVTGGNYDCPIYKSFDEVSCFADFIIDFSSPSALESECKFAATHGIKLVVCATGLDEKHFDLLKKTAEKTAVFYSANNSLGVYAMKKICALAKEYLKDFDVGITEIHHALKKDAPSGTAKVLAEELGVAKNKVHSLRGGSVFGEHSVIFLGNGEKLTVTHEALSREIFADGAFAALEFIRKKPLGFFGPSDVFDF